MTHEQFMAWRKKIIIKSAQKYGLYMEREYGVYDDYHAEEDYSDDIAPYKGYIY